MQREEQSADWGPRERDEVAGLVPQVVVFKVGPMVYRPPRRTKMGHEERARRPRSAEGDRRWAFPM
jgi:hypothetical protein